MKPTYKEIFENGQVLTLGKAKELTGRMNKLPVDVHPSDQDVCFKCRHRFAELLPTPHLFCNRSGKVIHDWETCLFYEPQNGRGTMTQTYYRKLSKKDHQ